MLRQVGLIALALAAPHVAGAAGCPTPVPPAMQAVTHAVATVNGFKVDQYSWFDSKCLARTAALKQEGGGNKGHGGYAVQMTYHLANNALVTANAPVASDGGFGYFVSHERYRDFTDGKSGTIALHVFHVDDSPLGLDFPVVGAVLAPTATSAAQRYTTTYSHYGTVAPIPKNAKGDDVTPTPVDKTKLAKYLLPVTLTWVFQAQHDSPRVDVKVDLSQVPGPDRINFDLRAPYGVLVFDNGADGTVARAMWGDRYQFANTTVPITHSSKWVWNTLNPGRRYTALIAGNYEMGLFEPLPFKNSRVTDPFANGRGLTSNSYKCSATDLLPCDYEWPYQSVEYSLPDNLTGTANYKKMAWGSSAFYGSGPSLPRVFDTGTTSENFIGFPASKTISYSVCVLLGQTSAAGLTKSTANGANPSCAGTKFP